MSDKKLIRILAVCLGNICRSPICHGLLEHYSKLYDREIIVDSAGTIGMHAGSPPDPRSVEVMKDHGHISQCRDLGISDITTLTSLT